MKINPETGIDGYKVDHRRQYPTGTQLIFSNLTPRKTRRKDVKEVVFAGLQYFIKEILIKQWTENFFKQPKDLVIKRFVRRINNYLGPNNVGTQHIEDLHDLGYLPIAIYALPEGSVLPLKVPPFIIFNTNPNFFWLTNYLETIMSTTVWGMCTSATTSHEYKKLFTKFALETVGNTDFVPWQGHDFSFRGMFGMEAAQMSGAMHLLSFTGTDTIPAIDFLEEFYNADCEKELIGGSVAADEHSVACTGILQILEKLKLQNPEWDEEKLMAEADIIFLRRLITEIYPTGIFSNVSDSFDYWNTLTNTTTALKKEIMSRDGKVVFRPDTGDPVKIVCGYSKNEIVFRDGKNYESRYFEDQHGGRELSAAEIKGSIEVLWEIFGGTYTDKGFRQLDSHIGLIYGDSITIERATEICEKLKEKGFTSTNLVYGIGSYTYQYVTRDTDGYAVKATFAVVNGQDQEIYKNPKTDDGTKKSAKGLTAVFKDENGKFYLKDQASWDEVLNCELKEVFRDGELLKDWTLGEVRANLAKNL